MYHSYSYIIMILMDTICLEWENEHEIFLKLKVIIFVEKLIKNLQKALI